jgi:hypothetical protein
VDTYAWLLAFHLIAAFAIAAALTLYTALVIAGRRMRALDETSVLFRLAPIGGPLIGAGSVIALILGIVLALKSDAFDLWDGWVIAAIVLWVIFGAIGSRDGAYYANVEKVAKAGGPNAEAEALGLLRARTGPLLHIGTLVVFLLLLLDMLFKPGA